MTFLILLLGSLYEPRLEMKKRHCPIHPVRKKPMICSDVTEYAADMNILLSHDHLRDDWEDEKKLSGLIGGLAFRRRARYVEKKYPRQAQVIYESLKNLNAIEQEYLTHWKQAHASEEWIPSEVAKRSEAASTRDPMNTNEEKCEWMVEPTAKRNTVSATGRVQSDKHTYLEEWQKKIGGDLSASLTVDIDEVSRPFGELMGEMFVWKEDSFAPILRRLGFFLGKYIYIRDALDDIEKDRKKGCFNPFMYNNWESGESRDKQKGSGKSKRDLPGAGKTGQRMAVEPGSRAEIEMVLDVTRRAAIAEFEKLPLERNITILRNILYEGIMTEKKKEKKK